MIRSATTAVSLGIFDTNLIFSYLHGGSNQCKCLILEEKDNLINVVIYNFFMLAFGYLGESGKINKKLSVSIGFVFFYLSFKIIYSYAEKTQKGLDLFYFLTIVWSLYGVSALFDQNMKNICYNNTRSVRQYVSFFGDSTNTFMNHSVKKNFFLFFFSRKK